MRILRHLVTGGFGIAAGVALAAPALAVTNLAYTFNTSNSNLTLATSTGLGNTMSFQSQVGNSAVLHMSVTAWNATIDTNQTITDTNKTIIDTRATIIDTTQYKIVNYKVVLNPTYNKPIPNPTYNQPIANPTYNKQIANPNYNQYVISKATLGEYAGGLGVTSKNDDLTVTSCGVADCGTHQIDNFGNNANSSSIDFIKLDFDYAVTLGAIKQSAFASYNASETSKNVNDDDFSYGKGASDAVGDQKVLTAANFTALLATNVGNVGGCTVSSWQSGGINLTGCNDTRSLVASADATNATASKTWYIAASLLANYGGDGQVDSFKLASLTAYYTPGPIKQGAVPEPSTWMTMIAGFGVAGVAMRRARRQKATAAA